jgi:ubiquinone/menaquinone biosynthesis C-methylase UbiE
VPSELFFEIHRGLPREGPGRNVYTRQAFGALPAVPTPRILDIGCGPGAPTLELARLSGGHVVGIDIHQPYLDELTARSERAGLADRVEAVNCSMFAINFPDASFDIVWAEGSIYLIGFERGLTEWRRLLKPAGCLVVHEMTWLRPDPPPEIRDYWRQMYPGIRTVPENLARIPGCGYRLLAHFTLPVDAWWIEYYEPLQERIGQLRDKYRDHDEALAQLAEEQQEIDLYRKYHQWYGSVFFLMEKT